MKTTLFVSLFLLSTAPLISQNDLHTFTILMGGTIGEFRVDGGGSFDTFYPDRKVTPTGFVGLGNGETFLVVKYRIFQASGNSELKNLTATGKADWKQTLLLGGFRLHPGGSAFYFDGMYVINEAEESISTEDPVVEVLASSEKLKDHGFAFTLGLAPRLVGPLALNMELEYSFMLREARNRNGDKIPNLGGLYYSAGLSLYFNN